MTRPQLAWGRTHLLHPKKGNITLLGCEYHGHHCQPSRSRALCICSTRTNLRPLLLCWRHIALAGKCLVKATWKVEFRLLVSPPWPASAHCVLFVCVNFWQRAQSLSFHTLPYQPYLLPLDLFLLPVLKLMFKEGDLMISPWMKQNHQMHSPCFEWCTSLTASDGVVIAWPTVLSPIDTAVKGTVLCRMQLLLCVNKLQSRNYLITLHTVLFYVRYRTFIAYA